MMVLLILCKWFMTVMMDRMDILRGQSCFLTWRMVYLLHQKTEKTFIVNQIG